MIISWTDSFSHLHNESHSLADLHGQLDYIMIIFLMPLRKSCQQQQQQHHKGVPVSSLSFLPDSPGPCVESHRSVWCEVSQLHHVPCRIMVCTLQAFVVKCPCAGGCSGLAEFTLLLILAFVGPFGERNFFLNVDFVFMKKKPNKHKMVLCC